MISSPEQLIELAAGVFVWNVPNGPNAGVVVDDDGLTVIDTLMVASQWQPFAAAVTALGLPIRRVVLTDSRIDHVGGTRAFPNAAVYGSEETSIALDQPMPVEAYRRVFPEHAGELEQLAEFGTRTTTHLITDAAALTPRIEALPVNGFTEGDVLIQVPDVDVCFTGDLLWNGETPLAFAADFDAWIQVLEHLPHLAEVFVPGHGAVSSADDIQTLRRYLFACESARGDAAALAAGPWDAWSHRERSIINVERAHLLAENRDELPRSFTDLMSG